jgi:hypothetical protein
MVKMCGKVKKDFYSLELRTLRSIFVKSLLFTVGFFVYSYSDMTNHIVQFIQHKIQNYLIDVDYTKIPISLVKEVNFF